MLRRFLAVLAGLGLAMSFLIYLGTFRGTTFDSFTPWWLMLFAGAFLLNLPMFVLESSSFCFKTPAWIWFSGGRPIERASFSLKGYAKGAPSFDDFFFWKGFSRGMPNWIVPIIKLLGFLVFVQFILFLVQTHAGVTKIKDGEHILNRHANAAELRMFAAAWVFFYFVPAAYWWFPRNRHALTLTSAP
jgi:hypothetical protein